VRPLRLGEERKKIEEEERDHRAKLDGCIVWNAHNTVPGEESILIYIVPVCYVKTGKYGKT